jgi:hypothetical protein
MTRARQFDAVLRSIEAETPATLWLESAGRYLDKHRDEWAREDAKNNTNEQTK